MYFVEKGTFVYWHAVDTVGTVVVHVHLQCASTVPSMHYYLIFLSFWYRFVHSSVGSVPDPDPPDPRVFLTIRIRIHQSDVWIRIRFWIRILLSSCKNNKKNLESYYFVTLFYFFIFEK